MKIQNGLEFRLFFYQTIVLVKTKKDFSINRNLFLFQLKFYK